MNVIEVTVPPVAATADATTELTQAPYDCTVTAAEYIPVASIGAGSTLRSLILSWGAENALTSVGSLALGSGRAHTELPLQLSSVDICRQIPAGETLRWLSGSVGDGIADPGGTVRIHITRGTA